MSARNENQHGDKGRKRARALTFVEVCAGAGGFSTGLIRAGFKPISF